MNSSRTKNLVTAVRDALCVVVCARHVSDIGYERN